MPFSLVYEIVGNVPNETATHEVKLPDTFTLANYTTFAVAMATALNNFITGKILFASLIVDVDISALTDNATPDADSDVEEVGAFEFVTAQGNPVKYNVGGLDDALVVPFTHELDETATEVADFITMIEDGIAVTGGTISPSDVAEDDIVGLLYAEERFRKSAKRRKS